VTIVLNVHTQNEDNNNNTKDSFQKETEQVLHHSPRYHMIILLGDFNAKLIVNSVIPKTLAVKNTMFLH